MIVGYARTSSAEQRGGLDAQLRDLTAAGCEEIYSEQISSVVKWAKLDEALKFVRRGDVFMVTKPDRLARSTTELLRIVSDLEGRGIGLLILSMGGERLDTTNPTSRLILTIMGAIASWEREIMRERQIEGIARAKAELKYKGRQPTARAKAPEVLRLAGEGITREMIAKQVGVGIASVYRILAAPKSVVTEQQPGLMEQRSSKTVRR